MNGDERRFNEREVALIMEHASAAHESARARAETGGQGAMLPGASDGMGLTMSQLTEIGREVGIPTDFVTRAAHAVDRGDLVPTSTHRWYGLPVGVSRTVDFGRRIDDAEWDRIVVSLRETFQARGRLQADGSFRQWTNGNLQALLEPTAAGHRLRLTTRKGNAKSAVVVGAALVGGSAVMIGGFLLGGISAAGEYIAPAAMALLGLLNIASTLQLPAWARTRASQMESITASAATPRIE